MIPTTTTTTAPKMRTDEHWMELALEEINGKGGVPGKKIELIVRDDGTNPGEAVRVAEELITREGVAMITGTFLSHIGLAVTNFAGQKKVFFLAAEPLTDKITWQNGNKYTYRLRATTYIKRGQEYDVILQTDRNERRNESDIADLYVRARTGELIHLSAVTKTSVIGDAPSRPRVNRLRVSGQRRSVGPERGQPPTSSGRTCCEA